MINRLIMTSIIAFSGLTIGCTNTRAIIEEKEAQIVERDRQIDNYNSQVKTLNSHVISCENELTTVRSQCNDQLSEIESKNQKLLEREQQLKDQLASDINLKNIEIERLKGQLTIKVLDSILFASGSIVILPEGKQVLTRVAASLTDAQEELRVEGHTDDVPIGAILSTNIPSNWELSVLRATSVVKFLENNGISSKRLSATGHSKFKPAVENTNNDNRQLNRRVEIVLLPKQ